MDVGYGDEGNTDHDCFYKEKLFFLKQHGDFSEGSQDSFKILVKQVNGHLILTRRHGEFSVGVR